MAQIFVTSPELRATANALRECNASFKKQVENLVNSEGVLNSQWEGISHDAFHASFMEDKAFMDKFAVEIEKYCQTLETMADNYDKAELENVETVKTGKV